MKPMIVFALVSVCAAPVFADLTADRAQIAKLTKKLKSKRATVRRKAAQRLGMLGVRG
jgi:hypothetical protein